MGVADRETTGRHERAWQPVAGKFVCRGCVSDEFLRNQIDFHTSSSACSYCGVKASGGSGGSAPLDDLVGYVLSAIRWEYDDPANVLPYDSAEGGYQGSLHSTRDLVENLDVSENSDLIDDIAGAIDQIDWCQRASTEVGRERLLIASWETFCRIVKERARYVFLLARAWTADEREYLLPGTTLLAISRALQNTDCIRKLPTGSTIFRARNHDPHVRPRGAKEMGPPSAEQARTATRMTPPGIPAFYGALEVDTAGQEAIYASRRRNVTLGQWTLCCDLTVVDIGSVTDVPLPSIFDEESRDLRPVLTFVRRFAEEVSGPIKKDGREHIEYVPTQIVAEYIRHYVGTRDWTAAMLRDCGLKTVVGLEGHLRRFLEEELSSIHIDGILYRSSLTRSGTCVALFVDASECADARHATRDARLVLDPKLVFSGPVAKFNKWIAAEGRTSARMRSSRSRDE
ncbi:MAG: RES domain-containing protein [Planctomycetes bacterium]|nr:RES domain-containing protein [Planctomycetota bacterium]